MNGDSVVSDPAIFDNYIPERSGGLNLADGDAESAPTFLSPLAKTGGGDGTAHVDDCGEISNRKGGSAAEEGIEVLLAGVAMVDVGDRLVNQSGDTSG